MQERNVTPFILIATATKRSQKPEAWSNRTGRQLANRPWPLSKQQLATWHGTPLHLGTHPGEALTEMQLEALCGGEVGAGGAHQLLCSPDIASDLLGRLQGLVSV